MTFAGRLKEWLRETKKGRRELCREAQIGTGTLYGWLNGKFPARTQWPVIDSLEIATVAELEAMDAVRKERRRRGRVICCKHCGMIIRKRDGQPMNYDPEVADFRPMMTSGPNERR